MKDNNQMLSKFCSVFTHFDPPYDAGDPGNSGCPVSGARPVPRRCLVGAQLGWHGRWQIRGGGTG